MLRHQLNFFLLTFSVHAAVHNAVIVKLLVLGGIMRIGVTAPPIDNCAASCVGAVLVTKNCIPELSITPTKEKYDGTNTE